ncbi:MAG: glutamine-hydrolyzing carbamoyl-phosphate synthase small subunit [Chloroflexota bacterium]|nr:glutamine-hydrolyzing carbamoyl-phosphate synthase small subunit [Chloroflexota bacterium]
MSDETSGQRVAHLVLSDGRHFSGQAMGAGTRVTGEVVFTTSMTGYQEALTDPSFAGQILTMTFPLQGNYGVTSYNNESDRIHARGFVVRELTELPSHRNSIMTLDTFLANQNILALTGVDTRALTRHLRSSGVLMGTITVDETVEEAVHRLQMEPNYVMGNYVEEVTSTSIHQYAASDKLSKSEGVVSADSPHIVLLDLGVKNNIMRLLEARGCRITVVPHNTDAAGIANLTPDGILLSPGPGDPELLGDVTETVKSLVGSAPILGICLGHQVVAKAFGATTYKMKFGHRGANHPVIDTVTGQVYITSQNHGFAVDAAGLSADMEITQVHLNDDSVEALEHRTEPVFTLQYHSEASPGPNDTEYIFDKFMTLIKEGI